MSVFITILLVLAAIIVLFLIIAAFSKKGYHIQRDVVINAPLPVVFDYIRYLKNWDNFNEPAMADPSKKNEFRGTDGTVGFIYAWSGNSKVGEGEKEIKGITEGKAVETEIRFIKPFAVVGQTNMSTEALSDTQTKVSFSNASTLKYPLNAMLLFVEKNIAKGIDTSLVTLKGILEK
ncbi:MAG: SRPBCC family protein [Chitinophagaceae bacterium]|nr:SRPBCC family protein [Chitinophagaceae bacterium]